MHTTDGRDRRRRLARRLSNRALPLPALEACRSRARSRRSTMDVDEDGGLRPGYKLKLNSLRSRRRHRAARCAAAHPLRAPEVRTVVVTSAKDRVFCSGANIFMLGLSSHAWKVNFCKFTNETRNGIEDSSRHSGLKFIAARATATAPAAATSWRWRATRSCWSTTARRAVSLPEVPLLGVLPGTGGLTRLTDKRRVRHDLADIFCTTSEGVRGQRAKEWRLVDDVAKPEQFARRRATSARWRSPPRATGPPMRAGIALTPHRAHVDDASAITTDTSTSSSIAARRVATLTIRAPRGRAAGGHRRHRSGRRDMVAAADGARARRRDPAAAHERARHRHVAVARPKATLRSVLAVDATLLQLAQALVRPRDDRHAAPHVRAARRHVAHALRADRAGIVLCRHAARARAGRRSQLHASLPDERRDREPTHRR